jgi:hypothetical protein
MALLEENFIRPSNSIPEACSLRVMAYGISRAQIGGASIFMASKAHDMQDEVTLLRTDNANVSMDAAIDLRISSTT